MICAVFLPSSCLVVFKMRPIFQGLVLVQVCVSCRFILVHVFRHLSLACEYEVVFTLYYIIQINFLPPLFLPTPILSPPFLLPPSLPSFIINCLHLEDSDRLITVYVSGMIKGRNAQCTAHRARNSVQRSVKMSISMR